MEKLKQAGFRTARTDFPALLNLSKGRNTNLKCYDNMIYDDCPENVVIMVGTKEVHHMDRLIDIILTCKCKKSDNNFSIMCLHPLPSDFPLLTTNLDIFACLCTDLHQIKNPDN